ncbi:helix-hairpin-helix domain-containing protein [bacterium]|nr:helix-hairpin-helix domain-containing protein [bacterium]
MQIPGVGKSIAQDFWDMGFRSVGELAKKNPEKLYEDFCTRRGEIVDRCMLYVFRCAVYYASHPDREPEKLKWWNWSDKKISSLSIH